MDFTYIVFAIFVILFIIIMYINSEVAKRKEKHQNYVYSENSKLKDIKVTQRIGTYPNESRIIIDEEKNKFSTIGYSQGEKIPTKIYDYKDLLEVEILEDGDTTTKTSRGSQLGGMLIGGLALGGVGAVIGGLSGKKKQIDTVRQIDLKLIINDMKSPIFVLNVFKFDTGIGFEKTSATYIKHKKQAQKWYGLLKVIIKKADEMDNDKNITTSTDKMSIADEIIKLKNLKDEGILSKKEFEEQKNKLLT